MHTSRQQQAAASGDFKEFGFRQRHLAQAIRLAFLCGAASALPAAASCLLDDTTITGNLTFTDNCVIDGTLDIGSKGYLTNDGTITNQGAIDSFGRIAGKGTLNNLGLLTVNEGGRVQIENSGNWNSKTQTLTGGAWEVIGVTSKSSLSVGKGQILTNAADIVLRGTKASFDQLSGLQRNEGTLSIEQGHQFTAASLYNTGTVTVASDGKIAITQSNNFDKGTLTGGTWQVFGGVNSKANGLSVGKGTITTNAANVLLSGAYAHFDQLDGLTSNTGLLTIAGGRSFAAKNLANTGTLAVASGGKVNISQSASLSKDGATLKLGRWEVHDGGTLIVGSNAITTNAADVLLSGANARFDQLKGLTSNTGTLTVADGHTFQAGFNNKGIPALLTNKAGGQLVVGNGGTLSIGKLLNEGTLRNEGLITIVSSLTKATSSLDSKGKFTNAGTLRLQEGTKAGLESATNLDKGTLTGGTWQVYGSKIDSKLNVGVDPIHTNAADILLSGAKAYFDQLAGLTTNQGSLTIEGGKVFTAANLENTGTLTVGSGSSVTVKNSKNFDGKTLTGGTWRVLGDGGKSFTKLSVGSGDITNNDASIVLSGLGSRFYQVNSLNQNKGSLSIEDGRQFTLADLNNSGTVRVASGGKLTLTKSGNLAGGILTGGIWEVDATDGQPTSLLVGAGGITTNKADIRLRGTKANFNDLIGSKSGLTENIGSLTIADGAGFSPLAKFNNTGTLTVASGGSVSITKSQNLDGKTQTLGSGTWQVIGTDAETSSLVVGKGAIATNKANVLLSGANARFDQLDGLTRNEGSLTIDGGKIFTAGALTNTGTLVVGADSQINSINMKNGRLQDFAQSKGSTRVDGLLDMGKIAITGGVLSGSGIVQSSKMSGKGARTIETISIGSDATVQPGNSPGTLTLDGNLDFSGMLDIEVESPTRFDTLLVTGKLDFKTGSKVHVLFVDFTPTAAAYSFNFLQAGSIFGQPSFYDVVGNIGGYKTDLLCTGTSCSFNLAAVPEPESYALFLAGLGLFGYTLRRRNRTSRLQAPA